jgi:hypothetical protein
MNRQRLALLLIVIFLFAGLLVCFGAEGFAEQLPPTLGAIAANATQKAADAMPLKGTTQPVDPDTVTMSATDFYDYLRPQILKTVQSAMDKMEQASSSASVPTLKTSSLPNPMPASLGEDYSGCKPFNKNEWIRKDSIPCYACTL